ncbi:MAG: Xaa-Pro peptidase family protein [Paracoccaceae bacterium]|nr:Xaa-Pro peptidase family protein [Paracoccaceae bacterium]
MLHFTPEEFAARRCQAESELSRRGLDGMLVFAPESQFWLTGFDTFGFCFFQCLVIGGTDLVLLTRSADMRQAELTSNVRDIRIWKDRHGADPAKDLAELLRDLGLAGKRLGIETDTHGLTYSNGIRVNNALDGVVELEDASDLFPRLRLIKSEAEIAYTRTAAELADRAFDAAIELAAPGVDEGRILAAMQGAIFEGGGDYPGNEFIIGSGEHALLCRYASGRRTLDPSDQLTLEWAGTFRHYHAVMMRTLVIGDASPHQIALSNAARSALISCEERLRPGTPMGSVYDAHRESLDTAGLSESRLNACGYSLGARFSPSWMEPQMFFEGADTIIRPGMVFFLHMIIMDSRTQTAMCLGRTSLVTRDGPESLSRHGLDLITR